MLNKSQHFKVMVLKGKTMIGGNSLYLGSFKRAGYTGKIIVEAPNHDEAMKALKNRFDVDLALIQVNEDVDAWDNVDTTDLPPTLDGSPAPMFIRSNPLPVE